MPMPPRTPWALSHCTVGVQKKSKLPFRLNVVLTLRANRFLGTWLKDWPRAYHRPQSRRVDFDCMVCQVKVSSAGHIKIMTSLQEGCRPCLATYQLSASVHIMGSRFVLFESFWDQKWSFVVILWYLQGRGQEWPRIPASVYVHFLSPNWGGGTFVTWFVTVNF